MFKRSCARQNTSKQPASEPLCPGASMGGALLCEALSVDSAALDFIIILEKQAFQPFAGSARLMTSEISFLKRPWIPRSWARSSSTELQQSFLALLTHRPVVGLQMAQPAGATLAHGRLRAHVRSRYVLAGARRDKRFSLRNGVKSSKD